MMFRVRKATRYGTMDLSLENDIVPFDSPRFSQSDEEKQKLSSMNASSNTDSLLSYQQSEGASKSAEDSDSEMEETIHAETGLPGYLYPFYVIGAAMSAHFGETHEWNNIMSISNENTDSIKILTTIKQNALHPMIPTLTTILMCINRQTQVYPIETEIKFLRCLEQVLYSKNNNFQNESISVREDMLYIVEDALKHFSHVEHKNRLQIYQNFILKSLGMENSISCIDSKSVSTHTSPSPAKR